MRLNNSSPHEAVIKQVICGVCHTYLIPKWSLGDGDETNSADTDSVNQTGLAGGRRSIRGPLQTRLGFWHAWVELPGSYRRSQDPLEADGWQFVRFYRAPSTSAANPIPERGSVGSNVPLLAPDLVDEMGPLARAEARLFSPVNVAV